MRKGSHLLCLTPPAASSRKHGGAVLLLCHGLRVSGPKPSHQGTKNQSCLYASSAPLRSNPTIGVPTQGGSSNKTNSGFKSPNITKAGERVFGWNKVFRGHLAQALAAIPPPTAGHSTDSQPRALHKAQENDAAEPSWRNPSDFPPRPDLHKHRRCSASTRLRTLPGIKDVQL